MATILVVDDDPLVLGLCQNILQHLGGYDVLKAPSGQAALGMLPDAGTIDLALLDVMMPGMNGIELARRIQKVRPNTRVALMTGYGQQEIARVAGGDNPYRIIWKPFKADSLLHMIQNMLEDAASASA